MVVEEVNLHTPSYQVHFVYTCFTNETKTSKGPKKEKQKVILE